MKLMRLTELLEQPPGTVFSFWYGGYSRDLCVFVERVGAGLDDFYLETLLPQPGDFADGGFDDENPELGFCWRWGLFDHEQQFAVYDKEDVKRIQRLLSGIVA